MLSEETLMKAGPGSIWDSLSIEKDPLARILQNSISGLFCICLIVCLQNHSSMPSFSILLYSFHSIYCPPMLSRWSV